MVGETLGCYRIVSTIGEGGMGVVYRGEHVLIGRTVAVKVLRRQMSHDPELVNRFFNEARTAALIQHPGLVEVFDFGYTDDGGAYIVMELLEGESLTARLARERKLSIANALAIARQVASALHAAHEAGIVHRDLKPENIFLVPDLDSPGQVRTKVLDFGIAKLVAEEHRSVRTRTGAVFGTPRYMAPEQCRNATNVDRRTDIYALGCILYEMVAGVAPFDYDSWAELVAAHMNETPRSPREHDDELPVGLEALIMRALAKKPADRFASMVDLAHAAETYWRNYTTASQHAMLFTPPLGMQIATPEPTAPPPVAPTLPVAAELSMPSSPRRRVSWLAVAGGAIVVTIVVIVLAFAGGSSEAPVVKLPEIATVPPLPAAASTHYVDATPAAHEVAPVDAAPAPPTRVWLVIESVPAGADVYRALDGVRLGKTPLTRELERTNGD